MVLKYTFYYDNKCKRCLARGDQLCSSREIPMSPAVIQEVKGIYKKCKSWCPYGDEPLIRASSLGFKNMVWGFIQCAKETNTNLDTDETGELHVVLQKFLGYENYLGQTALDVAIHKAYFDVVKAFATALEDLSWQQWTDRNDHGKTLLSLLSNHECDEFIFEAMKKAGKGKVDSSLTSKSIRVDEHNHQVSILVDKDNHQGKGKGKVDSPSGKGKVDSVPILVDKDNHQGKGKGKVDSPSESIVYTEHTMHPDAPPLLSLYNQSTTLNELDNGHLELDPNGNTIVHLLSEFGKADDLKTILGKHPSLVYRRNDQKETPLFVASREGHLDILELLINCVKVETDLEALVTRNKDKYTALHIAIEKHHAPIVFWLVNRLPQLANRINDFNESPLYFAAQRGYHHILRLILDETSSLLLRAFKGPNGKTALHAAVMSQESVKSYSLKRKSGLECVKSLLHKKNDLLYIRDQTGWAPFHYAVYHDIEVTTVNALLKKDRNIRSLEINDPTGRNILHVAVENKKMDTIKKLFRNKRMANQRDSNGNTPLHLFMASDIEIDEMRMDRGVNIYAVNNKNLTTLDVASSYEKRDILIEAVRTGVWRNRQTSSPSHESEIKGQLGDSLVVVTALITTATFAAAFTVPGGFDGNEGSKQGMPILLRKTAYKAFVVSNAVAFSCSCCVLFGYMRLQIYLAKYIAEEEFFRKFYDYGIENIVGLQYMLTGIAMVAMASAFITGTYVILAPSLAFAISLCATCVCIIVPLSFLPKWYFRCFNKLLDLGKVSTRIRL